LETSRVKIEAAPLTMLMFTALAPMFIRTVTADGSTS
jgi:hypothetical protein